MPARCFPAYGKGSLANIRRVGLIGLVIIPFMLGVLAWVLGLRSGVPDPFLLLENPLLCLAGLTPMYLLFRYARVCISDAGVEVRSGRKIRWQDIEMVSTMDVRLNFSSRTVRSIFMTYTCGGSSYTRVILMGPDDMDEILAWMRACIPPESGTVFHVDEPQAV